MDWVFCVSSTVSWWIWFIYLLLFGLCSRKYHFSFLNIIGWWSWLCCKCTIKLSRPQSSWKGASGSSFRSSFQEEAWKRYNRRMREEYEEEMERVVSFKLYIVFVLFYPSIHLCCFLLWAFSLFSRNFGLLFLKLCYAGRSYAW